MKKICYLLMSKEKMEFSSKQVLERVRKVSGDSKGCSVINAARGYNSHFDFAVVCENLAIPWPKWLKLYYIVCVPDSDMVALLLKVGSGVTFHLTVSDKRFVTEEMSFLLHRYCEAKSSIPVDSRDETAKIWKDQLNALLASSRGV